MKTVQLVAFLPLMLGACAQDNGQGTAQENEEQQTTIDETVTAGGLTEEEPISGRETSATTETNAYGNLQQTSVPEFEGIDIKLFVSQDSSIYSIEKSLLFTTGTAGLRAEAAQSLRKVSSSIAQRNQQGDIKIYGYIDPTDNPNYKRDVAQRRIEAVKAWLQESSDLRDRHIAVQPIIELDPLVDKDLAKKDQRIEIVVSGVSS